jgi:4-amino-4-deoxy-L-arabinose transferase-like glycosyltransferase
LNKPWLAKLTSNIFFWIALFFLVHLIGIWNPPIEAAHSWRQATGLMVARNYFEGNTSFWYPMVDETSGGTGIIGMEFPLMYYIQGKLGVLFGFHAGIGRLLNVLISTLGLVYFFALVRRFTSEKTAFYSTLLLMVSCFFMYSRKVMPDTEALAVYLMGIYYFFEALRFGRWKDVLLSFMMLSLGLLLKISVLPLLAFVVFAYVKTSNEPKKPGVFLIPFLSLIPACIWYFIWNPYLAEHFGSWYNLGGGLVDGSRAFLESPFLLLQQLVFHPFVSYLAFGLCLYGVIRLAKDGVSWAWKLSLPLFLLLFSGYALKSGVIFLTHEYYILPAVPLLAILGGYALSTLGKYAWVLMLCISMEAIGNQLYDFRLNRSEAYKLGLGRVATLYIPMDALVAINGNSNPQELYLLGRKGWNLADQSLRQKAMVNELTGKGCSYLVINKRTLPSLPNYGKIIYDGVDYQLIQLNN